MRFRLQMPKTLAFLLLCAITSTASAKDDPIESFRSWKDRTGKHEIEAEFVNCERSVVELKKTDGSTIKVPLKELSNADKWFVRKQLKKLKTLDVGKNVAPSQVEKTRDEAVTEKFDAKLPRRLNTKKMYGIDWHQTPESMQAAARRSSKSQKPVMWFRVLGDLEGFM